MVDRGNPLAVRVGPGTLYIAPLGSTEPTDLATAWDNAWIALGYTDQGSNFVFEQEFADVNVAEELDPVVTLQLSRTGTINFALAELTAQNLERAFNGGEVDSPSAGLVTFEPPNAGDYTEVMLGFEAEPASGAEVYERWVFRRCLQVGNVDIPRRKAPDKAVVPMSFRVLKPVGAQAFIAIFDADYEPGLHS